MTRSQITIFDTTLRDGEQSPGCSMTTAEKIRMARQIDMLGVDVLEAGFPIASHGDFDSVKEIAAEIRRPIIAGLARATENDIERCWQAVQGAARPRIHTFLATSDIHLKFKLRITQDECIKQAFEAVRLAKSMCADVEFSAEDATRTDLEFLCAVAQAVVEAGATTVNLPDTVGYCIPSEMAKVISTVGKALEGTNAILSCHCHNDLGLAVANSLAAVEAGARQVEVAMNGIGERAGNAALEEVVMALKVRANALPFSTGIVTEQLHAASVMLSEITGMVVQPNKAIVGRNAFAHEAGIHQDGMLKNPLTYEIITPKTVGVPDTIMVLGKHSGRNALGRRCEQLGYQFSRRDLDFVYRRFVALADEIKTVQDHHLLAIIREGIESGLTPTSVGTELRPNKAVGPSGEAATA
jgi:2-isopropylmalate synthase